ncbi:MAG: hypothetical protein UE295_10005 [Acutalibacteraceae bacterium]|nr:hypothetical protein [Acutalibacteraceae bacterium]
MNSTEQKIYDVTNAYLGIGHKNISQEEVDCAFEKILPVFEDELQNASFVEIKANLYDFWGIEYDKNHILVPMPVNRKAQAEYNKRFGIEE